MSTELLISFCEGKERTKLLLTPEGQHVADEVDNSNNSTVHCANEVLLISLGMSNDCPGMLSEQKVFTLIMTTSVYNSQGKKN